MAGEGKGVEGAAGDCGDVGERRVEVREEARVEAFRDCEEAAGGVEEGDGAERGWVCWVVLAEEAQDGVLGGVAGGLGDGGPGGDEAGFEAGGVGGVEFQEGGDGDFELKV